MIAPLLIEAAITGPMRRSPGRTLLAVLAIALGVALGLAIYLINRSAADEISLAARSLYGLADLVIEGGAEGLDQVRREVADESDRVRQKSAATRREA